jgi:glycosyltransferase involved in cell wall biosynthesis
VPHKVVEKHGVAILLDVAKSVIGDQPYVLDRYRSRALEQAIRTIVANEGPFDLCVCDFLFPAPSIPRELPIPVILFQHNVEARIWRRHAETATGVRKQFMSIQYRRMLSAERDYCLRAQGVVAVSESDAEEMRTAYGVERISAVDTGVDTEFFAAPGHANRQPGNIVFVGSMDWMPNIDAVRGFANDILPKITREIPEASFTIVGRRPTADVIALRGRGIEVTGTVDDIRPYLARASLMVLPLRIGGGTRLKLYEALAAGVPTLSTSIGAEGLPLRNGEHLWIADEAEAFAAKAVAMLRDPAGSSKLADQGADFVTRRFGWESVARQFVEVCQAMMVDATGTAVRGRAE